MARKTIEQRLAELDAQRASLKARLGKTGTANDTRRKGAARRARPASPRKRQR